MWGWRTCMSTHIWACSHNSIATQQRSTVCYKCYHAYLMSDFFWHGHRSQPSYCSCERSLMVHIEDQFHVFDFMFLQVSLYIPRPVFTHRQLYVAMSRRTTPSGLKILDETSGKDGEDGVTNIVYKEIFMDVQTTQGRSTRLNNTSISNWFCLHELTSPILWHCILKTSHYLQWKQHAAIQVHEDTWGSIPLIIMHFNASATTSFAKLQSILCWDSSLCFHFYIWSGPDLKIFGPQAKKTFLAFHN